MAVLPANISVNLSATTDNEVRNFVRQFGEFGKRERRAFGLTSAPEVRDSGAGADAFTITGHASVFERESLDLGGFTEFIAPDAFTNALSNPNLDVHALWDHDTRYVLARTPKTLDLQQDEVGLRYWARVVPTSYAADLRVLMEAGAIDQASFAFTVARDEWRIVTDAEGEEQVVRTILEIAELFDVTVCARGAYPQASSGILRAHILGHARSLAEAREDEAPEAEETPAETACECGEEGCEQCAAPEAEEAPAEPERKRNVALAKARTRVRRAL